MQEGNKKNRRSVSKQISSRRIKRAIKRRRKARSVTHLYDHSLPCSMLFVGIINRARQKRGKLPVRVGKHEMSPFVVSLQKPLPEPQVLLDTETATIPAPNLLEGAVYTSTEHVSNEEMADDLMLELSDVAGQLAEDLATSTNTAKRWVLPSVKNQISRITLDAKQRDTHQHPETITQSFSAEKLVPEKTEVSEAYFDIPETDDEPAESDLVSFDELAAQEKEPALHQEPQSNPSSSFFEFPKLSKIVFHLPDGWGRAVGVFVLLSFVFVFPIYAMSAVNELRDVKAHLTNSGNVAVGQLKAGADATLTRDVEGASNAFSQAKKTFREADQDIQQLGAGTSLLLSSLPGTNTYYKTGTRLLEAGESLSSAGERLAEGFRALNDEANPTPTSRLAILQTYVEPSLKHLKSADKNLNSIDKSVLPEQQTRTLTQLQQQLPTVIGGLEEFMEFSDMALKILGDEKKKRYLVVFQNNTEIRPTGGFMGSFAEIDIEDGEIVDMNIPGGGTYDLQGSLKERVVAPKPLRLLRARWEFQDTNWFPDFPSSARQMLDFHSAAGGPTVDGVIAVNATYVANLLEILGPVEMPEYDRTITSENFIQETQKIVEVEYDKEENTPKAFIGDLAPKLLDRIKNKTGQDFLTLAEYLNNGLTQRDIQIYFTDNETQKSITQLGWGGSLKWTKGDYLMVVDTNLGGGKTDGLIGQRINMDIDIKEDGSIENTVKIKRTHYGDKEEMFGGVNNVNYLRLYTPKGSTLLSADGFSRPDESLFEQPGNNWKIDEDIAYHAQSQQTDPKTGTVIYDTSGKTVFGNWTQTKPGTSSTVTFTYKLPFKIDVLSKNNQDITERIRSIVGMPKTDQYTLTIQQQSGILDRTYNVNIDTPETIEAIWSTHQLDKTIIKQREDAFLATLFERKE